MLATTLGLVLLAPAPAPGDLVVDLRGVGDEVSSNGYDRQLAPRVVLDVDAGVTDVYIAPQGTSVAKFEEVRCSLSVAGNQAILDLHAPPGRRCQALLDNGNPWLVKAGNDWITIRWPLPSTDPYEVEEGRANPKVPPLPREVIPGEPTYHRLPSDGAWTPGDAATMANGRPTAPASLHGLLEQYAQHDTGLKVLVFVQTANGKQLAKLDLSRKALTTGGGAAPTPTTFDVAAECLTLLQQTTATASAIASPPANETKKQRRQRKWKERRNRNAAFHDEWRYQICVDATDPAAPVVVVLTSRPGADPVAERTAAHLFAGRRIDVAVWSPAGVDAIISLGGSASRRVVVAPAPDFESKKGGPRQLPKRTEKSFAGRSGDDDFVDLTVQLREKSGSNTIDRGTIVHPLRIEDVFIGAFRVAASATWAPWERTWKTHQRGPAGINPGAEVAIDEGADSGLAHVEFVAGYTQFWFPVYEHERTVTVGSFFGLGVIGTGSAEDLTILSSVHVAPLELTVGRYFGVGLDVALRRSERLRDGLDVGSPVSASEDITRFAVTPSFGLVLNFSPQFARSIGLARKGIGQ